MNASRISYLLGNLYPYLISKLDVDNTVPIQIAGVANAAGFALTDRVAPGELISIYGAGLGPEAPAGTKLDQSGRVTSELAGVTVLVDGVPAPLLYVSRDQISAVTPFGIAGKSRVNVQVRFRDVATQEFPMSVVDASPAIFTREDRGIFIAAALNQDGTIHSRTNPAWPGSIVTIFATGAGLMMRELADGEVPAGTSEGPRLPVTAVCWGPERVATVMYAGVAPGMVAGVLQVNVPLPAAIDPFSCLEMRLRVGDFESFGVSIRIDPSLPR